MAAVRVVVAVAFTQGCRTTAERFAPIAHDARLVAEAIRTAPCASSTFHGVISREALADGVLEGVAGVVFKVLTCRKKLPCMIHVVDRIVQYLFGITGRRLTFHAWEVVLFVLILPLGLKTVLADRGRTMSLRAGSRVGLRQVAKALMRPGLTHQRFVPCACKTRMWSYTLMVHGATRFAHPVSFTTPSSIRRSGSR